MLNSQEKREKETSRTSLFRIPLPEGRPADRDSFFCLKGILREGFFEWGFWILGGGDWKGGFGLPLSERGWGGLREGYMSNNQFKSPSTLSQTHKSQHFTMIVIRLPSHRPQFPNNYIHQK